MRFGPPRVDELYDPEKLSELHKVFIKKGCVHEKNIITLAAFVEKFVVELFGIESEFHEKSISIRKASVIHACKRTFVERIALRSHKKKLLFPVVEEKLKNFLLVSKINEVLFAEKVLEWLKEREKYSLELDIAAQYALYMVENNANFPASSPSKTLLSEQVDLHGSPCRDNAEHSGLFCLPKKLDFEALVSVNRFEKEGLMVLEKTHYKSRDDFCLSDNGLNQLSSVDQAGYCLICHPRKKDTCRSGFTLSGGEYKRSTLGIVQKGCPLRQRISEMNQLYSEGKVIAALAVITLDNPMCAATGNRICNDCMRACIYQKQEPVNIPGIESAILNSVLELPYGFEIYSLFTRWNPLRVEKPSPLKLSGKKVLISGSGPAGFTLAHYLLNDGHTVVLVDGVKIEPLPLQYISLSKSRDQKLLSSQKTQAENSKIDIYRSKVSVVEAREEKYSLEEKVYSGSRPRECDFELIKDVQELYESLDDRVIQGFGGVAEYGITVRWNKNYLKLIRLLLERRSNFRIFGGVRFGSNLTVADCKRLGFEHIALCVGGGSPNIPDVLNILARGVRFASDFLMSLQLGGAFKKDSVSCLQIRMPVIVIGGGLTAVDSATEVLTYYKVQVEKFIQRYEQLVGLYGGFEVEKSWSEDEKQVAYEFLSHARNLRKVKHKTQFLKSLGGVKILYRKRLQDSPAYRLNFEELNSALLEGIEFVEEAEPLEVLLDKYASVSGLLCLQKGRKVRIECKNIIVAAGTKPNQALKDEFPLWYDTLESNLTFFGDLDPNYAGSVVGAMASAKDKYPLITQKLLQTSLSECDCEDLSFFREDNLLDERENTKEVNGENKSYCKSDARSLSDGWIYKSLDKDFFEVARDDVLSNSSDEHFIKRVFDKEKSWHSSLLLDKVNWQRNSNSIVEFQNMRFLRIMEELLEAKVQKVTNLSDNIFELHIYAPLAAQNFMPGQFYKLQSLHSPLEIEPIALTGSYVNKREGMISLIVIEVGASSYLCKFLRAGQEIVLTGPLGIPTEIPKNEKVLLIGGGLGNAVLFSVAEAMNRNSCKVLYFAGYKRVKDRFKMEMIESFSDAVVWVCDEEKLSVNRSSDISIKGNMLEALESYVKGEFSVPLAMTELDRVMTIGSDSLMHAVQRFIVKHRYLLKPTLKAIASINSPMQCMMKGICAQCVQKKVVNGREEYVYSCVNQDQNLEATDFAFLSQRLKQNSLTEKLNYLYCRSVVEGRI